MKIFARIMVVALLAMGMLAMGKVVQAQGLITSAPQPGFVTTDASKDNELSVGSPSFTADLSTYANFLGEVHTIAGFENGGGGAGSADLQHQEYDGTAGFFGNIDSAYVMVGRGANGDVASFAYKFTVPSGFQTTGGTIAADVYFNGNPVTQGANEWVGVTDTLVVEDDGGNASPPASPVFFQGTWDLVDMRDLFVLNAFNNYTGTVNLTIPAGLTEFYVGVVDEGTSARLALTNLTVNASIAAIPEPSSFALAGFGLLSMLGLARRRK